ncbi:MAG: hypothetical protein ACRCZS_01600 [Chroococcidiopsis sp.]
MNANCRRHNFILRHKVKIWSGATDEFCEPIFEEAIECIYARLFSKNTTVNLINAVSHEYSSTTYAGHILAPKVLPKGIFNKELEYEMIIDLENEMSVIGKGMLIALPNTTLQNRSLSKIFGIPASLVIRLDGGLNV